MRRNYALLAFGAVLATVQFGCRDSGPPKVIVSGAVTFQGEPIANGDILFYPIEGTVGPVSGGPIVNGQYEANGKGGVPIGRHRVEIRAYRSGSSTQAITPEEIARMERQGGQRQQYIPEQFNSASTLTLTVGGEESEMTHNFDLKL
jgi:hypothetical protein